MALAVLGATFDPAGYTARRSILPDAAEAADRPVDTLNGVHEGIFAIGWTVGPVAGAALIAAVGAAQSFWAPFVLFLVASGCVAAMRVGDAGQRARAEAGADGEADRGWTSWTQGFTALWRDRPLRLVTLAVVVLAAIYMPTEAVLLPTYFERLGEPGSLGIVISALSLGAMIGAFGYGWLTRRLRLAAIARLVLAGVALSIVPMALLPPAPGARRRGLLSRPVLGSRRPDDEHARADPHPAGRAGPRLRRPDVPVLRLPTHRDAHRRRRRRAARTADGVPGARPAPRGVLGRGVALARIKELDRQAPAQEPVSVIVRPRLRRQPGARREGSGL